MCGVVRSLQRRTCRLGEGEQLVRTQKHSRWTARKREEEQYYCDGHKRWRSIEEAENMMRAEINSAWVCWREGGESESEGNTFFRNTLPFWQPLRREGIQLIYTAIEGGREGRASAMEAASGLVLGWPRPRRATIEGREGPSKEIRKREIMRRREGRRQATSTLRRNQGAH